MRVYGFAFYVLVIFLVQKSSTAKSVFNSRFNPERDDSNKEERGSYYIIKRKTQNQLRPVFLREHEGLAPSVNLEMDNSNLRQLDRYRRVGDTFNFRSKNLFEKRPLRQAIESELDLKRNQLNLRKDRIQKRDLFEAPVKRQSPYGIVYGNGRPVGILEPYPATYELASLDNSKDTLSDTQPFSRSQAQIVDILYPLGKEISNQNLDEDGERNEADSFESAKYSDEKYPSVLTNFKIDSKMKMNDKIKEDQNTKRNNPTQLSNENDKVVEKRATVDNSKEMKNEDSEAAKANSHRRFSDITPEKIDELKVQLQKLQNPSSSDNLLEIEENLKNVLEDMGLIDEDSLKGKQETLQTHDEIQEMGEDENLEEGSNKIELTKDNHLIDNNERNKRENEDKATNNAKEKSPDSLVVEGNSQDLNLAENNAENKAEIKEFGENQVKGVEESIPLESNSLHVVKDSDDANYNKPDGDRVNIANYQNEGDAYIRSKRQEKDKKLEDSTPENSDIMKGLEKSGELTVSGNKSPLASKNEDAEGDAKRKATSQKTTCPPDNQQVNDGIEYEKRIERDLQAKIDAIKEQVKREIDSMKNTELLSKSANKGNQRKKRETFNTLLDEETSLIDPGLNTDETLKPLVRRRRNNKVLTRKKRDTDFSNLQSIDSGDYLNFQDEADGATQEAMYDYIDNSEEETSPSEKDDREVRYAEKNDKENEAEVKTNGANKSMVNEASKENVENNSPSQEKTEDSSIQESSVDKQDGNNKALNEDVSSKNRKNEGENSSNQEEKQKKNVDTKTEQKNEEKRNVPNNPVKSANENLEKEKRKAVDVNKISTEQKNEQASQKQKRNDDNLQAKFKEDSEISKALSDYNKTPQNRRRRQINNLPDSYYYSNRDKRGNNIGNYNNPAFLKFRDDDDEMDDEGDEFEDDGFDDRTTNLLRKRQADYLPQSYYRDQKRSLDYQNQDYDQGYEEQQNLHKPNALRTYIANMNSDVYEKPTANYANYLYSDGSDKFVRRKRQNFDQLAAIHGGGPMINHLAAIRERSQRYDDDSRKKRKLKRLISPEDQQEPQQLEQLSDTDLFGALPQSYEGELSRFKRVKRGSKPLRDNG